ncbi:hypothetical protein CH380_10690 [Leptospira adleri]|uniref:Uncharacterized protein n=1 Tax=Leptospira adleri TaxID=2023186 RepID=A0A2M9YNY7_9LEPT|nr:hypothetical protein CH380_10690 [Leptospira adleri]PJZ63926.1 hypothetical protein CH376_00420 [Leptospira adleri]
MQIDCYDRSALAHVPFCFPRIEGSFRANPSKSMSSYFSGSTADRARLKTLFFWKYQFVLTDLETHRLPYKRFSVFPLTGGPGRPNWLKTT